MFIVRWILGRIILLLNFVFAPKKRQRPQDQQVIVDQQTQSLALYQYAACPFCVKVRREMRRQSLTINLVDAKQDEHKSVLTEQGGKLKVPCLRIEQDGKTQWLYESKAITSYLNERFA
jgi:glutaredoxin